MPGTIQHPIKISVLLPVYNAGLPLRSAIESILVQEFSDFEFLILDDASKDGSKEIIREYAKQDSRIRPVYRESNQGLARTLNEGLQIAQGELVARMDQDDESLPERLKIQYLFMKTRPEVAVVGSYAFQMGINKQKDRLMKIPTSHQEIVEAFRSWNCIYHPSVMMRRKKILHLGGYRAEFKNAEDYDLWLRVSRKYQLANIPIPLLRYRFSMTGMTLSRKWEQIYFFFLAQAAQANLEQPISTYEKAARDKLEEINRPSCLEHVARVTAEELIRLGYFWKGLKLIMNFSGEIGRKKALILADQMCTFALNLKQKTDSLKDESPNRTSLELKHEKQVKVISLPNPPTGRHRIIHRITYHLVPEVPKWTGLEILVHVDQRLAEDKLSLRVCSPEGRLLRETSAELSKADDTNWIEFSFEPIINSLNRSFVLDFAIITKGSHPKITFYESIPPEGKLYHLLRCAGQRRHRDSLYCRSWHTL